MLIREDIQRAVRAAFALQQPNAPRDFRFFRNIVVANCAPVILVALGGCAALAPDAVRIEAAHESHASVGSLGCSHNCSEDGLTTASVMLKWRSGPLTIEAGEGINLRGRDGGGFVGPREVFTARAGYEIPLKR